MDITLLPFNKLLGIKKADNKDYILQLDAKTEYTNHLGTVHAAALFALAEGSAGQFLLDLFPEFIEQVVSVVRKAEVVYKKPAIGIIVSTAKLKEDTFENINIQLQTKKRASIIATVDLFDENQVRVLTANFEVFVIGKS